LRKWDRRDRSRVVGQEIKHIRPSHINLQDEREVRYWMARLNISRAQVQTVADTLNKRGVVAPPCKACGKES